LHCADLSALLSFVEKADAAGSQTVVLPILHDHVLHGNREPWSGGVQPDFDGGPEAD